MEIFESEDYKSISKLVEEKLPILRENKEFNEQYLSLTDKIESFDKSISGEQKKKFNEIVDLFYMLDEYYFAFSYSLGVKYGNDLSKIK